jgi:hypothetical protein
MVKVTKAKNGNDKVDNKIDEVAPGWRRPGFPSAKKTSTDVVTTGSNPWSDYGASVVTTTFVGKLLKFSKGDYTAGKDDDEVAIGTHMVVNMLTLTTGWMKWVDNRPTEQRMGLLVEGFQPPQRSELGDLDEEAWPLDDKGKAQDPWRFTNNIVMADAESGEVYTFTTASRGGLNAIGLLCKGYGECQHLHPEEWPLIELNVGSYQHSNRAYGRIKYPILDMIGWSPKDAVKAAA